MHSCWKSDFNQMWKKNSTPIPVIRSFFKDDICLKKKINASIKNTTFFFNSG